METEYWRSMRKFAGIMSFCALTYSHPNPPRGLTCDNFQDVKKLKYEPYFYQYVRPAFSPVGLMINFWDEKVIAGTELKIPVNIIIRTPVSLHVLNSCGQLLTRGTPFGLIGKRRLLNNGRDQQVWCRRF